MSQRGLVVWLLVGCLSAAFLVVPSVGCGEGRPKIRRPEKPTPPPDESMKLHSDASHSPTADSAESPADRDD